MKIVYHHRIASKDGQAVHIDGLVGALRHAGHQVVVVGPPVAERTEFGAESGLVAFIRRRLPRAFAEWLELAYNVPAFFRIWRAVKRHAPDAIYERYNLFLLAGAALRAMTGIPLLLEVNAPLFAERCRYGGLTMKGVARGAEKFVWRRADVVLPVTEVLAQSVGAAGVDPARIVVIPNGVSEEFLTSDQPSRAVRSELGIDGRLVLGFVGFVRDWHGLDAAIDVVAERGDDLDLHLLVIGDGPALEALRRHAARRGAADRVTFTGIVPRSAIRRYVAAFDVALQPSVVPYASPLKIFEYMALGLPIVAPDAPNVREILRDGETALLTEPDHPQELAAAIERLAGDVELRKRLAGNARQTLLDRSFTWRANAERVVALAAALAEKRCCSRRAPGDPQSSIPRTGEPI